MFWNKKLNEKIDKLQKEIESTKEINENAKRINAECNVLISKNDELKKEINNLKSQLREDTEADVYFSCVKIQKRLIDGESKESVNNEINLRNSYLNQLSGLQHSNSISMSSNFGNQLANIFGQKPF